MFDDLEELEKENTKNIEIDESIVETIIEPVFKKFYSKESDYGIYGCYDMNKPPSGLGMRRETISIVGNMPELTIGKRYTVKAEVAVDPKWGLQYKVMYIMPEEMGGKEEEHNFIKALVTPRQFDEIIKVYDMPASAILDGSFDFGKVKGIGKKTYDLIKQRVFESKDMMKALGLLSQFGITYNQIKRITEAYESSEIAIQKIKEDPYILYRDVDGIGFLKADQIPKAMGMQPTDPKRITAAVMFTLENNSNVGNTWMYKDGLIEEVEKLLEFSLSDYETIFAKPMFYTNDDIIALKRNYDCEMNIKEHLTRINNGTKVLCSRDDLEPMIAELERENQVEYTNKQKELFYSVCLNPVTVMTGNAGCGKSFTVNGLLHLLNDLEMNYMLMAPTARAAKVLEAYTGNLATTIHRALMGSGQGGYHGNACQFFTDLVIVDEASMVDIYLFRALLQSIPDNCKLLIIGDDAQLESVSAGNVLGDIKDSKVFTNVTLDKVFRQALDSGILSAATDTRNGKMFFNKNITQNFIELGVNKDFKAWFGTKDQTEKRVLTIFKELIKTNDINDIMVISPMRNGGAGINNLNLRIQEVYNPESLDKKQLHRINKKTKETIYLYRVGDKVMHTVNMYDISWMEKTEYGYEESGRGSGVVNGDIGIVIDIDEKNECVYVDYGDKIIMYDKSIIKALTLAYCATVHKCQGGGFKNVVFALDFSHYIMLKRNLLYTAITRAKDKMFLVGDANAISMAIGNDTLEKKRTFLFDFLTNK